MRDLLSVSSESRREPSAGERTARLLAALALGLCLAGAGGARGQALDPDYTPIRAERGLQGEAPFVAGQDFETISTSSGNLLLRIPLGQAYSVGPVLSYQLQAVYNSNAWDHFRIKCLINQQGCTTFPPRTFSLPDPESNAGVGWSVHLGRLYQPIAPAGMSSFQRQSWPNREPDPSDNLKRWKYVAPDGSIHYLYRLNGRDGGTASLPVRYSKDGSYLRMRQTSATRIVVSRPDGVESEFEKTGQVAGTNFCDGSTITECWRLKQITDPYGNYLKVSYSLVGNAETWTLTDSTQRKHYIRFTHNEAKTGGGDGAAPIITADGDQWGDLRKVVTEVDLAAFGGQRAVYGFATAVRPMPRACPHEWDKFPASFNSLTAPVLEGITVPESQDWAFETSTTGAGSGSCTLMSGKVTEVTTPAQGRVQYTYGSWRFPNRCDYNSQDVVVDFDHRLWGILRKKLLRKNGSTVEAEWQYSNRLYPTVGFLVPSGSGCTRANYRKTTVRGPLVAGKRTRTDYYTAVTEGTDRMQSGGLPLGDWRIFDAGLP